MNKKKERQEMALMYTLISNEEDAKKLPKPAKFSYDSDIMHNLTDLQVTRLSIIGMKSFV